jgi:hypothetical protein
VAASRSAQITTVKRSYLSACKGVKDENRMRQIVVAAALSILAGCQSPQLSACEQAYPKGSAGYQACWADELQRQSAELDHQRAEEYRARGGP